MAIVIQLHATTPLARNGDIITVNFADNTSRDFDTFTDFQAWITGIMSTIGDDGLKALACTHLLTLDPAMDTPAVWAGKTFTLDPEQSNPANIFKKV